MRRLVSSQSSTIHRAMIVAVLPLVAGVGCHSGQAKPSQPSDPPSQPSDPLHPVPAPLAEHPPCVISADCPAGQHCDLQECVQDCSTQDPCTGELTCSPRARCLSASAADTDPPPPTRHLGDVTLSPSTVALTASDKSVKLTLTSSAAGPVPYRVQINGPHLSLPVTRGSFIKSTDLVFQVDPTRLQGRDVAGSVQVFTSLGDVTASLPIHVGLTGRYHGFVDHNGSSVPLGRARVSLEILETNGNASLRILSGSSLLFPATDGGEATGYGSFTPSTGLDFTVRQRIASTYGKTRNHFARDLGRSMAVHVAPSAGGNLEGTFADTLYGLFSTPVTVSGAIQLVYEPNDQDPVFTIATAPAMPPSPSKSQLFDVGTVFGMNGGINCASYPVSGAAPLPVEVAYYQPLLHSMPGQSSQPFAVVADACRASFAARSLSAYQAAPANQCAFLPPIACALGNAALNSVGDVANGQTFSRLFAETLAPALLVAKDHIVQGLWQSFATGPDAEFTQDNLAMAALAPATEWVLQPAVLEYLRTMSPQAARGNDPQPTPKAPLIATESQTYPAARALADALSTAATVDAERARAQLARSDDQAMVVQDIQARAVLNFFEVAAVTTILDAWSAYPPEISSVFSGVLTPEDNAFAAAILGKNVLGVPDGFVPFVYRPEDSGKGATNFEQVALLAAPVVAQEKAAEQVYSDEKRAYDSNNDRMQDELKAIRSQFDQQIQNICGSTFDPNAVTSEATWTTCGANQTGDLGLLIAQAEETDARLSAALNRLQGMQQKIAIDQNALKATQSIHTGNIGFLTSEGVALQAIVWSEGEISAAQRALELAAQSNFWNMGAPAAEAGGAAALETARTGCEAAKQALQTVQQVVFEQAAASIEQINGMAAIQKEMIDLGQARVDMQLDVIARVEAMIRMANALAQAKALYRQRAQALVLIGTSSLNDPSVRLLRDHYAIDVLKRRADAQQFLYLAGAALEYELNLSIASLPGAVLGANNGVALDQRLACMSQIFGLWRTAHGTPQDYATTVSVRQLLGITGPRTDTVTGQVLTEGEQFRQVLLTNQNLDGKGGVGLTFATDLQPSNKLWSTDVCVDHVKSIQAQIVGDYLGDNQAQVNLALAGAGIVRDCDTDTLETWNLGSWTAASPDAVAVIQAGVNTYGDAPPNTSLFGQPIARASWKLIVPGPAAAPTNGDLDLTHIEDITLKITHTALPRRATPLAVDLSCLGG